MMKKEQNKGIMLRQKGAEDYCPPCFMGSGLTAYSKYQIESYTIKIWLFFN